MDFKIIETIEFSDWLDKQKNQQFKIAFERRMRKLRVGHFGDYKRLDEHLFELRFFIGPGYRVYYTIQNDVILLIGSDKKQQHQAIKKARAIFKQYDKG